MCLQSYQETLIANSPFCPLEWNKAMEEPQAPHVEKEAFKVLKYTEYAPKSNCD